MQLQQGGMGFKVPEVSGLKLKMFETRELDEIEVIMNPPEVQSEIGNDLNENLNSAIRELSLSDDYRSQESCKIWLKYLQGLDYSDLFSLDNSTFSSSYISMQDKTKLENAIINILEKEPSMRETALDILQNKLNVDINHMD